MVKNVQQVVLVAILMLDTVGSPVADPGQISLGRNQDLPSVSLQVSSYSLPLNSSDNVTSVQGKIVLAVVVTVVLRFVLQLVAAAPCAAQELLG